MTARPTLTTADYRRAAAFIAHHGQRDLDGLDAILVEANEEQRVTALLLATLELYQTLVPALYTPLGMSLMSDAILRLAAVEGEAS